MAVKPEERFLPTEHEEQVRVVSWCGIQAQRGMPELERIFAIANGGARAKATAGKLKAEGVKPGVPDLMLPVPKGIYAGMFIEMKRRKGGTVSAEQKDWTSFLGSMGYKCVVCRGADEAKAAILDYMGL